VTVAGAVAESVTGRSFRQLSADFFAAHGITGFFLDDNFAIVPNRVRGYLVDRDSKITFQDGTASAHEYLTGTPGAVTNARDYDISSRYPAGGFDSSGEDLLKFVIAVGTGKVLPPDRVREMWTAQPTDDGKSGVFGIGWGVSQREGQLMVGMNGSTPSTTASLRYFPESGVGVALLCNAEGAQDLSKLLDDIVSAAFR
jgi:CubicO group peptidase (beta-lactamase class C family)